MHTLLSKFFGRKKPEDKDARKAKRTSATGSLLEGKFEAVPPVTSPSATHLPDHQQHPHRESHKDKDTGFALFRPKSRAASPPSTPTSPKRSVDVPHLSLNLPVPKEERSRALGVVFEADPDALTVLDEAVIGERRLTPLETLVLVRACSQVIVERGLETLGIMHAHWYSASPEVQRRLISLYIHSLASKGPITTLTPSSSAPISAFHSELTYTRSPHDVAAVLRWGLRHLRLDGPSFGKDASSEWAWYTTFADAERSAAYPPNAFSQTLVPQLPPANGELLFAMLDLISSLAAHGEANGFSGSKLSKFLGLWLLSARRSTDDDDWNTFYDRWERAGRILEHLFLSRIRDEAVHQKMPRRLTELIEHYPYNQSSTAADDGLLTRPRFSTRSYDALYVHLVTEYTGASKPRSHPLRIIAEALRSTSAPEDSELAETWAAIKRAAQSSEQPDAFPVFSNVFTDETIRLLSLIPADTPDKAVSPTFALLTPTTRAMPSRRRSFSLPGTPTPPQTQNGSSNGHASTAAKTPTATTGTGTAPTTASPDTPTDWAEFTSLGFATTTPGPRDLAATLWDTDVEVTAPPEVPVSRKSSRSRRFPTSTSRRSSVDSPNPSESAGPAQPPPPPPAPKSTVSTLRAVKLDEAFIDFWCDALLDPVAASFAKFVLCELKPLPSGEHAPSVSWLVIEQTFARPSPPPAPTPAAAAPRQGESESDAARRPTSPRPSVKSDMSRLSSTFSLPKKRFSFFGRDGEKAEKSEKSAAGTASVKKKASKAPRVGEMGEIVKEEEEGRVSPKKEKAKEVKKEEVKEAAEKKEPETTTEAAVKGVAAATVAASIAAVATEAVASSEEPKAENGAAAEPATSEAPAPTAEVPADANGDVLPPAPAPVVLAGETPGPQLALDSSEPAAVAETAADAAAPALSRAAPADVVAAALEEEEAVEETPAPVVQDAPVAPAPEPEVEPTVVENKAPIVEDIVAAEESLPAAEEATAPAPAAEPVEAKEPVVAAEEAPVPQETTVEDVPVETAVEETVAAEEPAVVEEHVEEPAVEEPPAAKQPAPVEEAPAPAVEEAPVPQETSVEGAPLDASVPKEPVAVEEAPVPQEETVEEVPAVVEESAAVEAPAPVAEVHAVDEPAPVEEAPVPQEETVEAVPVEALAVEEPAPVEEAPAPVVEEAAAPAEEVSAPADEVPAAIEEAPAPVEEVSAPVEAAPAEEVSAPAEETSAPAAAEEPAAVEDAPVPQETTVADVPVEAVVDEPAAEEPAPTAEEPASAAEEPALAADEPAAEEATPAAEEVSAPAVEEPAVEEEVPVVEEVPAAEETAPAEETPVPEEPIVEESAPAAEEPTPAAEEPAPAAVEESTPAPAAEEHAPAEDEVALGVTLVQPTPGTELPPVTPPPADEAAALEEAEADARETEDQSVLLPASEESGAAVVAPGVQEEAESSGNGAAEAEADAEAESNGNSNSNGGTEAEAEADSKDAEAQGESQAQKKNKNKKRKGGKRK